eukprot:605522-Pelagomonas_calceolata.AAC.1
MQDLETKASFFSTCKALRCDAVAAQVEVLTVSCLPKDIHNSIAGMERFAGWCPNLSTLCLKASGGTGACSDDDLSYSSEGEDYSEDEYGWSGMEFATIGHILQLLKHAEKSKSAAALLSRITCLQLAVRDLRGLEELGRPKGILLRHASMQTRSQDFEDFKAPKVKHLVTALKAACPQLSSLCLEDVEMDTPCLSALQPLQLRELTIDCMDDLQLKLVSSANQSADQDLGLGL